MIRDKGRKEGGGVKLDTTRSTLHCKVQRVGRQPPRLVPLSP